MKLKFDASLGYQQDAIQSVVGLFKGQPLARSTFEVTMGAGGNTGSQMSLGKGLEGVPAIANQLTLQDDKLLNNLHPIQEKNDIPAIPKLDGRHFSVEMETGTGKTYVYLRTLFELNKSYGFTKFIIVVPSVPVREGVLKSIEVMKDHFRKLYDNVPFKCFEYDRDRLSLVREFATSNQLQIMVVNIQKFDKDNAVMHKDRDDLSGYRPIDFISTTNPVVMIDEPQSVEGDTRKAGTKRSSALDDLNPMLTLRYSATHFNKHNLLYKLDPIQAFDLKLVKRIEVASMREEESFNSAYMKLLKVDNSKGIKAQVEINAQQGNTQKRKKVWVKLGDDLYMKSGEVKKSNFRPEYQQGYQVAEINCEPGFEKLTLSSGRTVTFSQPLGDYGDALLKAQIEETIEQHLKKEKALKGRGIKVLSLFFIDKVASYREYDEQGNATPGKFAQWFEEAYSRLTAKAEYKELLNWSAEDVHNGYFSKDKKGKIKDTKGTTQADDDTYALIMRDKERLLDDGEPLRFIFSHTALREGWDNPNVFQICTLNESNSVMKKRQEIGRGLRLPVNSKGERVHDASINRLTVIANDSYEEFARQLQSEYEEEYGIEFGQVPEIAFAKLINSEAHQHTELGQDASKTIFKSLQDKGYLDTDGKVQDKFDPTNPHFVLELPEEFAPMQAQVSDKLKKFTLKSRVVSTRDRKTLTLRKNVTLDENFRELWERIGQKTRYRVQFDTSDLVARAAKAIAEMPDIKKPRISIDRVEIDQSYAGVEADTVLEQKTRELETQPALPDILAWLQNATELTRQTLVKILVDSGRLAEFFNNPQVFVNQVTEHIRHELHRMTVKGIQYSKVDGATYEMHQIEQEAQNGITRYLSNLYEVRNQEKTLYDYVIFDSDVEKEFAKALDDNESVKFYCKLPSWFKVDTPVGPYNPDWAVVTGDSDEKLYLVRETKSTTKKEKRREEENDKIECAEKHFETIDVDYRVCTNLKEALEAA